jgi:hypothetical protein
MVPSKQQAEVVEAIGSRHVVCTSQPGSGKTTLALNIVRKYAEKEKIILLTYNRALADETRRKGGPNDNFEVFTFHGLASSLTNQTISNDLQLASAASSNFVGSQEQKWGGHNFTILIVDEMQDMRPQYVDLVLHLLLRIASNPVCIRMLCVGDTKQLLYSFYPSSAADGRFLTGAQQIFGGVNGRPWQNITLTQSFRATVPICNVVNKLQNVQMSSGCPVLTSSDASPPVVFFICNVFKDAADLVLDLVTKSPFAWRDTLVLSSSLNERSPAVAVVAKLVNNGIGVHVSRSGRLSEGNDTPAVMKDKVLFKTFCGAKGLESPFVIVLNHHPLFENSEPSQFVALTRAKHTLVVIHHHMKASMETVNSFVFGLQLSDIRVVLKKKLPGKRKTAITRSPKKLKPNKKNNVIEIATLFTFIDVVNLEELLVYVQISEVDNNNDEEKEQLPIVVSFDNDKTFVDVTSICGSILRLAVEYYFTQKIPTHLKQLQGKLYRPNVHGESVDSRIQQKYMNKVMHILTEVRQPTDNDVTNVLRRLQAFAMGALCLDAFHGYAERLLTVKNFEFVFQPVLMQQFHFAIEALAPYAPFEWYQPFEHNLSPEEKITGTMNMLSKKNNVPISFIHRPTTSQTDLLRTVTFDKTNSGALTINTWSQTVHEVKVGCYSGFLASAVRMKRSVATVKSDAVFYEQWTKKEKQ